MFSRLGLAVQRQRQEFRKFQNSDGITPVYLTYSEHASVLTHYMQMTSEVVKLVGVHR